MKWQEVKREDIYDATNGWGTEITYEGPKSELESFEATELPPNYSRLRRSKELEDWATIVAAYFGEYQQVNPDEQGLISRTWELEGNEIERPLSEHENVAALFDADPTWPARIRYAVEDYNTKLREEFETNGVQSTELPEFAYPDPPAGASEVLVAAAEEYAKILLRIENPVFTLSQYVLRKTELVTSYAVLKASHDDVDRMLTPATLLSRENTLEPAALINAAGLTTGWWQKKSPKVLQVSWGQFQIVQEYWHFADYYTFIYGVAL